MYVTFNSFVSVAKVATIIATIRRVEIVLVDALFSRESFGDDFVLCLESERSDKLDFELFDFVSVDLPLDCFDLSLLLLFLPCRCGDLLSFLDFLTSPDESTTCTTRFEDLEGVFEDVLRGFLPRGVLAVDLDLPIF